MMMTYDDENRCHDASIVSQLVNIGHEENQQRYVKGRSIIEKLQCLQLRDRRFHRVSVDAFRERNYVAISYTWRRSKPEGREKGKFDVENWDSQGFKPSPVRDCVFDRILSYMRHKNVKWLWIDRHSVCQDKSFCTHQDCVPNAEAMQVMDLVYQCSMHPVGLLGRPMEKEFELALLKRILSGSLVEDEPNFRLATKTSIQEANAALRLLSSITKDRWWHRAWTFQENYRGGERMRLLISLDPSLESQKLRYPKFGTIPGELCIEAVCFSTEATRLCLALRNKGSPHNARINKVLRAAGRYALLLEKSRAMTQAIVDDIEARKSKSIWDRLPIIANCCQYSVRLDGYALNKKKHNLGLSVLAMCLLNGEILDNGNHCDYETQGIQLTVSEFLHKYMFQTFDPPRDTTKYLTFNKRCRLVGVKLTPNGISAIGHLWKLGRVIDTAKFRRKLPWINNPKGQLTVYQRRRLLQLVLRLRNQKYRCLADQIDDYLKADAQYGKTYTPFTRGYLHQMASELSDAIRERRKLRLGSINDPDPSGRSAPYLAIFVCSKEDKDGDSVDSRTPSFVFTSAWPRDPGTETHDANDIDHHVSLEVVPDKYPVDDSPHLRVRRWMLGMCFFGGCPRTRVVFPWPKALEAMKV